jgi:hypothetical protein
MQDSHLLATILGIVFVSLVLYLLFFQSTPTTYQPVDTTYYVQNRPWWNWRGYWNNWEPRWRPHWNPPTPASIPQYPLGPASVAPMTQGTSTYTPPKPPASKIPMNYLPSTYTPPGKK